MEIGVAKRYTRFEMVIATFDGSKYVIRNGDALTAVPKNLFERTHKPLDEGLNFGMALEALRGNFQVMRKGWMEEGKCLVLAGGYTYMGSAVSPFILLCAGNGVMSPWVPTHEDLLARDYLIIVEGE